MLRWPFCRRLALPLAGAALAWASVAAQAGSFSVVPVRILVGPRERAVAVTLTNLGDTPIALNAELYDWKQGPDGIDQLTPTDDLVLAPPVIRLAPKRQQVVRLALLRAPDPQVQLAYRMIVREVPEASPGANPSVAIPVAVAMNLPVFVTPPGARWEVDCAPEPAGSAVGVRCRNAGNATAVVRSAEVQSGGRVVARFAGAAYILPGNARPIALQPPLEPAALPAKLVVTFEDDHQAVQELPAIGP